MGLACVLGTSVLTAATIPMIELAIRSIQNAAPVRTDVLQALPGETQIAEAAGVSRERVREELSPLVRPERALPPVEEAAAALGVPTERLTPAYEAIAERPEPESNREQEQRQTQAVQTLGLVCLAVVGIYGIKYMLTRGQTLFLGIATARLASDLRSDLFRKLQRLPIGYFSTKRTGSLQSVLTNDVGVFQSSVQVIRDSIDGPVKAGLALVAVFIIQWQLALVAFLFIPILAVFVHRNGQKMKSAQAAVQEDLGQISALSQEGISGVRVVKAFSAESRLGRMFDRLVEKQYGSQVLATKRLAVLRPMVELLGAVSLAAILYIAGWMAKAGTLQISQIVALTFALDVINQGARSLANVNNVYRQVQAAADRIHTEVLDVAEEPFEAAQGRILEPLEGRIAFENVGFTYPDGTTALKGVSFVIEPGTSLALVGPSGAGKSTIADLLLRFYDPTEGRITLDGVDIRELQIDWLRGRFGVVPQQTVLFAGTIAENLRLGVDEATDEDLRQAAKAANALPFIERSDRGMLTELGERGARISGGEAQRLAIARALVPDPRILVLDEATSALDAHSEKAVTEALQRAMSGRTTLFIAHRLTTAARADRILMLRQGETVEGGSHDELMAQNGAYAAMYRAFSSGLLGEV
ncbi:MAG: ABC transporter ATP-binding protein/permease [Fimbriimonadaceae bacterium]|nr:ABC transporter ATP-binding protein/permease [Fimbriimonadaceae bacterium]